MTKLIGQGVSDGIAIGRISFFAPEKLQVCCINTDDTQNEIMRYEAAKKMTLQNLKALYERAKAAAGQDAAEIFEIHSIMLNDTDFNNHIYDTINSQHINAEYAVSLTEEYFSDMFRTMDNEYMQGRSDDVHDICCQLINFLCSKDWNELSEPDNGKYIVCADNISPSETMRLNKSSVLAFITSRGSANSHTAILAHSMEIPAIVGINGLDSSYDSLPAIADGFTGTLIISPDSEEIDEAVRRKAAYDDEADALKKLIGKETVTQDGRRINLYANISGLSDLKSAVRNGAEGIGLFRTEFLYLESDDYPTEEYQFSIYSQVLERMGNKKVIIRTIDIGADKSAGYFMLRHEDNPSMGVRAIRYCLEHKDIFKTHLRALLRASVYGNTGIMFPMITSVGEVREIKALLGEVKDELDAEGKKYSHEIEIGIMIETPAAAIISDILACEVDFFSIGTNDLTQYLLAADRQNPDIDRFYDPHHPAVLRTIRDVIKNAHDNGIWVGICGQLGADTSLTTELIGMGIDEISVPPADLLKVKRAITEATYKNNAASD